ncbi:protein ROLLING AND ERECT LEAF 2-like [Prosopis cineraria]|uniref:protein ROLLING AND ERECT LEAF 2-like n=1 Tax=Prosopis cineraria TaxID=364024 RepID=UPI00240E9C85|nr:protein ROLLING AND ERECT LEAF 2-like [Prosopis cineraria]
MGCTISKLDDLPAVALCRQRCAFLDETIRHCHALSAAHLSYVNSLQSVALSLQQLHFTSPPHLPSDSDHRHDDDDDDPHHFHPPPFTYNTDRSYMKNHVTPSQLYEQTPISPHAVRMRQYSSFCSSPFSVTNPDPSPCHADQTYDNSAPPYGLPVDSSSEPPPRLYSTSDFGNFYYQEDGHYSQRIPSQSLKEIREAEGIPDLEDDDYEYEVVEPVQGDQSDADDGAENHSGFTNENQADLTEASLDQTMPIGSMENDEVEVEHEVHDDESFGERAGPRDSFKVASEIEVQFRRASESGMEIAGILEVGSLPYYRKHGAYQAFSKMLNLVAFPLSLMVSRPSISKRYKVGPRSLELDRDMLTRTRNLSSTLQKLHLWERKLYKEVKAEEKMRVLHDQKCRMLKRLDDRGADFQKVDSIQTSIKNLTAKIRMAIQVVELISVKINKTRDEELWPRVNELIHGLTRMWKSMLECHRIQCETIRDARSVGWIGCRKKSGVGDEATKQLERELINWTFQFSSWISAQKRYVRALNNWLLKCLLQELEETSPGRMEAPGVFVICNRWCQAMERISEKAVLEIMYVFTRGVLQIWERERMEIMLDKDVGRNVEREEQKLQKQIQAAKQKMVMAYREVNNSLSHSEDIIYDDDEGNGSTVIQARLQQIFEAMENFTGMSARLYEELMQSNAQEERATVEQAA